MKGIVLSVRVVPQLSARRELLQALLGFAGSVRKEPGVLSSNVYEDVEDPAAFRLETEWADGSVFEEHLRSGSFGALLGAFELLAQPARLKVTTTADAYGNDPLAVIRRLRESRRAQTDPGSTSST